MPYKPSRSSGIAIDKYHRNEEKYLKLRDNLISRGTVSVKDIPAASRYCYLAAKNGAEGGAIDLKNEYHLPQFCGKIFLNEKWKHLVHRKLLNLLTQP